MTVESLARALGARKCGAGYRCCCPLHGGGADVFSIAEKNGRILLCCFAGCPQTDVLRQLAERGLWEPERSTIWERLHRAVDRLEEAERNRMAHRIADVYDLLKLRALVREDWKAWKRYSREQGRVFDRRK